MLSLRRICGRNKGCCWQPRKAGFFPRSVEAQNSWRQPALANIQASGRGLNGRIGYSEDTVAPTSRPVFVAIARLRGVPCPPIPPACSRAACRGRSRGRSWGSASPSPWSGWSSRRSGTAWPVSRFVCFLIGLVMAGTAVSLRLKTAGPAFEERMESAGVLAVARLHRPAGLPRRGQELGLPANSAGSTRRRIAGRRGAGPAADAVPDARRSAR